MSYDYESSFDLVNSMKRFCWNNVSKAQFFSCHLPAQEIQLFNIFNNKEKIFLKIKTNNSIVYHCPQGILKIELFNLEFKLNTILH